MLHSRELLHDVPKVNIFTVVKKVLGFEWNFNNGFANRKSQFRFLQVKMTKLMVMFPIASLEPNHKPPEF